jgi:hypothetical protein
MRDLGKRFPEMTGYALLLAITAFGLSGCGDDAGSGGEPISISSVTPSAASAGDMVTIEGTGFSADPAKNVVSFTAAGVSSFVGSRTAIPVEATSSNLRVEVPEGSFTGGVAVRSPFPISSGPFDFTPPGIPSNSLDFTVRLLRGDVAKIYYAASSYDLPVTTGQFGEEYILILFDSATPPDRNMTFNYSVDNDTPCTPTLAADESDSGADSGQEPDKTHPMLLAGAGDVTRSFERKKWEEVLGLLRGGAVDIDADNTRPVPAQSSSLEPQEREFFVFSNFNGSTLIPDDFTLVTADLKYEGTHTLLYVDQRTDITCITDPEAEALGLKFENSIYPTNTSSFGSEPDINHDGKVAILLTPVVNELTPEGGASTGYIAGFFMPGDLLPTYVPTGASNGMEIYYSMVPDPNGIYGNVYAKEPALDVIEGVIAHEFQHMIMFNYRILIFGNGYSGTYMAELWVDEGLAHIAEDLNNHDDSNIRRADLFLNDPGDVTLIHGGDDLEERGASFLFFRYLGDRFGVGVYRDIVQTRETGTANIEEVTGCGFKELFADWAATMYFESVGVTPVNPKYSYTSIDMVADFDPLRVRQSNICGSPYTGEVKSYGPDFLLMEFTGTDVYDINISSALFGSMNATLIRIQ